MKNYTIYGNLGNLYSLDEKLVYAVLSQNKNVTGKSGKEYTVLSNHAISKLSGANLIRVSRAIHGLTKKGAIKRSRASKDLYRVYPIETAVRNATQEERNRNAKTRKEILK